MEVNEKIFEPNTTLESLIKRLELFIEEQDWNSALSYLERVTDIAPENANVYMLGLLIEYKVNNDEKLKRKIKKLENEKKNKNCKILARQPKTKTMPKVGMTASEVRSSTWGYPDKINKDTYSWGTT